MILKFVKLFAITLNRCEATWREIWSIDKKISKRNWSSLNDNNTFLINSNASENRDFLSSMNLKEKRIWIFPRMDFYFETFDTEKLYLLLSFYVN